MNLLTDAIRDAQTGICIALSLIVLILTNNLDLLTSKESTINSTPEELRGMMEIVNDAKGSLFYLLCTYIPPCKRRYYSRHESRRKLFHVVCRSVP